jgi:nucleotide-binding universal stress UspA family protein
MQSQQDVSEVKKGLGMSQVYKKILVPLDGSEWAERALPYASDLARNHDAELVLLTVYKKPMHDYADQMELASVTGISDQIRDRAKNYMMSIRNQLRAQGLNASFIIVEGRTPADTICDYASDEKVDIVVMSTHGRTGLARFVFGSVAHKVLQNVRVPVMLIRPDAQEDKQAVDADDPD